MKRKRIKMEIQNSVNVFGDFMLNFAKGVRDSFYTFYQYQGGRPFKVLVAYFIISVSIALVVLLIKSIFKRRKI